MTSISVVLTIQDQYTELHHFLGQPATQLRSQQLSNGESKYSRNSEHQTDQFVSLSTIIINMCMITSQLRVQTPLLCTIQVVFQAHTLTLASSKNSSMAKNICTENMKPNVATILPTLSEYSPFHHILSALTTTMKSLSSEITTMPKPT